MINKLNRHFAISFMALSLFVGSLQASNIYASDNKKQETVEVMDEDNFLDSYGEKKVEKENEDKKSDDDEIKNLKMQILTVKGSNFVADTLHGVKALYRTGGNDGSNPTYSCAAYIKRYYKETFDVSVNNLLSGRTPMSSKGKFRAVKKPQVGDVVACSSTSGSNHWAVVKKINNNNTVTLIEQNWKWSQSGQTLCKINRSIAIPSGKYYRLDK